MKRTMFLFLVAIIVCVPFTARAMEYYQGNSNYPVYKIIHQYSIDAGPTADLYVADLSTAYQSENKIFIDLIKITIYPKGKPTVWGKMPLEMVIEGEHSVRCENSVFDPDIDSDEDEDEPHACELFWEIDNKIGIRRSGFAVDQHIAELKIIHKQPYYYIIHKTLDGNIKEELGEARRLIMAFQNNQRVITILDEAIRRNSKAAEAFLLRGMAKTNSGAFSSADKDFEEALILEPENPCFYYYRGLNSLLTAKAAKKGIGEGHQLGSMESLAIMHGGYDRAERMFNKALEIAPYYADVLLWEANLFEMRNDLKYYSQALSNYNRLLDLGLQQDDYTMVRTLKDALVKRIADDNQKQREKQQREQIRNRVNY